MWNDRSRYGTQIDVPERKCYELAVAKKNGKVPSTRRSIELSAKSSIETSLLELLFTLELKKTVESVTNAEIIEYLSNVGRETLKDEDETLKSVFRELKMKLGFGVHFFNAGAIRFPI
jgi:hypothetical protein